jgi:pimeloyl-ACP methyl ester carboxylesterase
MKNLIAALVFSIFLSLTVFTENAARSIEGNWLGLLEFDGNTLRITLKVSKAADGSFAAKFDSIDQGVTDLDIDTITFQDKTVRFEAKRFGESYEGTLNEKGDEISGTFKHGASSTPLVFKRITELPKLQRPQDPTKPYPYKEEEVSYENKKDKIKLAGTLTFPRTNGKHPAVILITGSGYQDRNETVVGHRPFLVLADYLTRKGIAVLRVDDRGVGGSDKGSPNYTSENFAGDVLAGIEYLKTRKEIDRKKIGLIGHSEGGIIASMVAVGSKDAAFIVMLASPGQTGEEILYAQNELAVTSGGTNPILAAQIMTAVKNMLAIAKSDADKQLAEQRINEAFAKQSSEMSEDERKAFSSVQASMKAQLPVMLSTWFRYFIAYNPRQTLEKVTIPVLALNGENDTQVSAKKNLPLIADALKAGGNKDYIVKSFPKLNHLFQTSQTGLSNEYDKIEETIAPVVLETIADWILKRTKVK